MTSLNGGVGLLGTLKKKMLDSKTEVERLKEEVEFPVHAGPGHARTVATQAPASLLGATIGPSIALSSLAQAYKVVVLHAHNAHRAVHACTELSL